MKAKKFLPVLMFVLMAMFVFATPVLAQTETPPKIEDFDILAQGVIVVVTALVTLGLKFALKEWNIDLSGKKTQAIGAIVLFIFETANATIASLPSEWYPVVVSGLGFIVALLTVYGVARIIKPPSVDPKK